MVTQVSAVNFLTGETIFDKVIKNIPSKNSNQYQKSVQNFFPYFSTNVYANIFSYENIPLLRNKDISNEDNTIATNENQENTKTIVSNDLKDEINVPLKQELLEPIQKELIQQELPTKVIDDRNVAFIVIEDKGFNPPRIEVKVNQLVSWRNARERTKSLVYGLREISSMRSPMLNPGGSFTYSFSRPGRYTYVDSVVIGKVGEVIVT